MEKTKFTLGEAAKATGYVKSKISADIKDGKLSANRETPTGSYQIDASELIRVYGDRFRPDRLANRSGTGAQDPHENDGEPARTPTDAATFRDEIALLKERLAMATTLHESEVRQLNGRIEDLRAAVEDAHGQRDRAMTLLTEQIAVTRQLTDQRSKETAIPMPGPVDQPLPTAATATARRGFLGLFGKRSP